MKIWKLASAKIAKANSSLSRMISDFMKKSVCQHRPFARNAGGKGAGPGGTICLFTIASATYARSR